MVYHLLHLPAVVQCYVQIPAEHIYIQHPSDRLTDSLLHPSNPDFPTKSLSGASITRFHKQDVSSYTNSAYSAALSSRLKPIDWCYHDLGKARRLMRIDALPLPATTLLFNTIEAVNENDL
jgi:hypothetical protein